MKIYLLENNAAFINYDVKIRLLGDIPTNSFYSSLPFNV